VRTVEDYPSRLLEMLNWIAPPGVMRPTCAVLTPGVYNSPTSSIVPGAADGLELVEGRTCLVYDGYL